MKNNIDARLRLVIETANHRPSSDAAGVLSNTTSGRRRQHVHGLGLKHDGTALFDAIGGAAGCILDVGVLRTTIERGKHLGKLLNPKKWKSLDGNICVFLNFSSTDRRNPGDRSCQSPTPSTEAQRQQSPAQTPMGVARAFYFSLQFSVPVANYVGRCNQATGPCADFNLRGVFFVCRFNTTVRTARP